MKNKQGWMVHVGTGMTPLLMLFCILCIVTFATLSYVQANSEWTLAKKAEERMRQIYEVSQVQQGEKTQ